MKRKLEEKPPVIEPITHENVTSQTRTYKLITPLYGGGVEPNKADPITVVRATEARGHLRFWWRATRGGQFEGDLEKMRKREEVIWGSSAEKNKPGPSDVSVEIVEWNAGTVISQKPYRNRNVNIGDPRSPWGYVAFPLREIRGSVRENVTFSIAISFPSTFKVDIETALQAWENFGGIGARTRRGFGALQCVKVNDNPCSAPTKDTFKTQLRSYLSDLNGCWHSDVPHVTTTTRFETIERGTPMIAWEALFKRLKDFRQGFREISNRNNTPGNRRNTPGRSKWPEPDAIRRRTSFAEYHKLGKLADKFPRAAFGLPINFEFKRSDVEKGDPPKTKLKGTSHDRLSSPLILRPIACSDGALGLALILETPRTPPGGLILDGAERDKKVESILKEDEAKLIEPLNGQIDVLEAFLNFLMN